MSKVKLTPEQKLVGAKYMAVVNMGMEHNFGFKVKSPYTPSQIEQAFEQTSNDFYGETGDTQCMNVEARRWMVDIKAENKFCMNEIKKNINFSK